MEGIEKTSVQKWVKVLSAVKEGQKNAGLYTAALGFASKPRRQRISVNLNKLSENAKESENVIVPGKILAIGVVDKKFSVSAIEYSASAAKHLKAAGCHMVPIDEMIKKDGVRLIV